MPSRVLHLCGPAAGGMRRHVEALAQRLPAHGFIVALAAPANVEIAAPGERFTLDLGDRPRPAADLRAARSLRALAKQWAPDLIHSHGVKATLLALGALPRCGPPVVATLHNVWRGGPLTALLRFLLPRAAAVIVVSTAVKDRLSAFGIRHRRTHVIANGVDLSLFHPAAPAPEVRLFTVAFVGRLTEEKGLLVLLEAAQQLQAGAGGRMQILIAGEGPLRQMIEVAAARCGSILKYLGEQQDVRPVYHAADAVVMPSLSEGHPLTALEAMACGLPVIASRAGGLLEIVRNDETGRLLPPGDAGALQDALLSLSHDRSRAHAMGRAGRRRAEQEFSLDRMIERTAAVYREVLTAHLD